MHSLYFYIYQAGIGLGVFEGFVFFQPLRGWIASMAGFHEAFSIVYGSLGHGKIQKSEVVGIRDIERRIYSIYHHHHSSTWEIDEVAEKYQFHGYS